MMRPRSNESGSILIVTVWIVALLSLLAFTVTTHVRIAIRQEAWTQDEAFARQMLIALAKRAVAQSRSDEHAEFDGLAEPWGAPFDQDGANLVQEFEGVNPAERPFTLSLTAADETGKINLNLASEELLVEAIRETAAADIANALAKAIVDWRDPDNDGAAEGDQTNAERRYTPTNMDFAHIEELLFVRDVTPEFFSGEDLNKNGILDPEEDDGDVFMPADNSDGRLQPGLRDLFTVHGDGAINVNGASEAVLRAVLRASLAPADANSLARQLVEYRRGSDGLDGTDDDRPFRSDAELREALGQSYTNAVREGIAFTVETQAIRYRLCVEMPDTHLTRRAELVIVREDDRVVVAEWRAP